MVKSSDKGATATQDPTRSAIGVVIFALASLIETRDSDTDNHILRIQQYVKVLATSLQSHPRFSATLSDAYIANLLEVLPLYDMGTIGIPDRILLKPSRLTPAEFALMQTHTTLARDAFDKAEKLLSSLPEPLHVIKEVVYSHQEKWDGSGYPEGLQGEAIPLSARLLAVADVYDALISDRVYKAGVSHDHAIGEIFQCRDSHFDPDIVDALVEIQDEFQTIARRFADSEQDMQKKIAYLANAIAEDVEL